MPLTIDAIPGRRLRFRLDGALAEPKGLPAWKAATTRQRLRYYPLLAETLLDAWRAQMLEGRGRRGKLRRPRPISRLSYVQRGLESTGPALLPQREQSRAHRHARVTPYADLGRVTGFFVAGTARWLSYHHEGVSGRGIPWFDDAGKIHWRGLPGQVTGIHRDLMPTSATIASAVAEAGRRWARGLNRGRRSGESARVATSPPARRRVDPRRDRPAASP